MPTGSVWTAIPTIADLKALPAVDLVVGKLYLCAVKHPTDDLYQHAQYAWHTYAAASGNLGTLVIQHDTESGFFVKVTDRVHYGTAAPSGSFPLDEVTVLNKLGAFTWVDTSTNPYTWYDYTVVSAGVAGTWVQRESAIADGSVTTSKIVDANVTTAKLADSAITTAKIANGAITAAKLASGVGGITSVATIAALKSLSTTGLATGALVEVIQPDGVVRNKAAIYAYISEQNVTNDTGKLIIRPDSGDGYYVALDRTELSTFAPQFNLYGANLQGHLRWVQTLTTPDRVVFWDWIPGIAEWVKTGPPVLALGVPTSSGDFVGQIYQNIDTSVTYIWKGSWSVI